MFSERLVLSPAPDQRAVHLPSPLRYQISIFTISQLASVFVAVSPERLPISVLR